MSGSRPVGRPPLCPPDTARLVSRLIAGGHSNREISDYLNTHGIPTPEQRGAWKPINVWHLRARKHLQTV